MAHDGNMAVNLFYEGLIAEGFLASLLPHLESTLCLHHMRPWKWLLGWTRQTSHFLAMSSVTQLNTRTQQEKMNTHAKKKQEKEKPQREHKLKRWRSDNEEMQLNCFLPFSLRCGPGGNPSNSPFWATWCYFSAGLGGGGGEEGAGDAETFFPLLSSLSPSVP